MFCPHVGQLTNAHLMHRTIALRLAEAEGLGEDADWTQWTMGVGKSRQNKRLDLSPPVMCGTCNNDWMNQAIELKVAKFIGPLFAGQPATLSGSECLLLARWLTLVSFLYLLTYRTEGEPPPVEARQALRQAEDGLPDGAAVYAFRTGSDLKANAFYPSAMVSPVTGWTMWSLGRLGRLGFIAAYCERPIATFVGDTGGQAVRVWPRALDQGVSWPPPRSVGSPEFGAMLVAPLERLFPPGTI
jgi:hypothetical protein